MDQIADRGTFALDDILQGFDSDIQADLVAILEAVGDGLRDRVDRYLVFELELSGTSGGTLRSLTLCLFFDLPIS